MRYAWIRTNRHNWPLSVMCEQLEVSISGFHQHQQRLQLARCSTVSSRFRSISNDALLARIKAVANTHTEYGWPRIWKQLLCEGVRVGKERVRRLMALHGIRALTKRRFRHTTNSAHKLPVAPNLVQRQFQPNQPNQVWTSDITYIHTAQGWLYMSVMLDLFNRQIVGWAIAERMTQQLVLDALRMAWFRRRPEAGLIVHSDRGSQYCAAAFQDALKAYGMRSSMSGKGDCWDNAPTESLWGSMKRGCVHGKRFATREEAKCTLLDWVRFYNAERLHSTLGFVSPMKFERNWRAAQQQQPA